jgi:peptidyl-tRNA hydrolase, PTH1 family
MTWLIAGLGNPGPQYESTRHNVGFMLVDYLSQKCSTFVSNSKYDSLLGKGSLFNQEVVFAKPLTFMNLSGRSIVQICNFYKISIENIVVVTDDLDQQAGSVRLRFGGGAGGHNGLRSILESFGGSDKFHRLKIGIGKPEFKTQVTSWVLGKFSPDELSSLNEVVFPSCFEKLKQIVR